MSHLHHQHHHVHSHAIRFTPLESLAPSDLAGIDVDARVRIPDATSRIYKDECVLCFDTAKSHGGLNICLNSFQAFCEEHIALQVKKHPENRLFLNVKLVQRPAAAAAAAPAQQQPAPTKLAIGVEGGFAVNDARTEAQQREANREYDSLYSLVVLTNGADAKVVAIPADTLSSDDNMAVAASQELFGVPFMVWASMRGILREESSERREDIAVWEDDQVKPTKHAENLHQEVGPNCTYPVPMHGYKCSRCDLGEENVWMCLSCGEVNCGRRYFDGSGGNNHGVEHYDLTKHPLVVKLGTIDAKTDPNKVRADVYSYPDQDLVEDPYLTQHLEFFGIRVSEMRKTVKTMAELNLDLNINYDFNRIQETGKELQPLFGPGYTGMQNLGNSCYMNSILQAMLNIDAFQRRYFDREFARSYGGHARGGSDVAIAANDLNTMMSKVANAVALGKYAQPQHPEQQQQQPLGEQHKTEAEKQNLVPYQDGICPKMFKHLVGRNHPEFSTSRQQDAAEFYQHLMNLLERSDKKDGISQADQATNVVRYLAEERIECPVSHTVKYTAPHVENMLSVPVPLDRATNLADYQRYVDLRKAAAESKTDVAKDQVVRPHVPMMECVRAAAEAETLEDVWSGGAMQRVNARKTSRLLNSPDYLVVQVKRFYLDGWVPKKLDVFVDAPQRIDIASLRKAQAQPGLLPGEAAMPDVPEPARPAGAAASSPSAASGPAIDMVAVESLVAMGFPQNRAEKAVVKTANQGVEAAMSWLLDHMEDADIDAPIAQPQQAASQSSQSSAAAAAVSEDNVVMLQSMGFDRERCVIALQQTGNNIERAGDWLFSHMDDDDLSQYAQPQQAAARDGGGQASSAQTAAQLSLTDGASTQYDLIGFVSHIGSSTGSGHYVCHLKRDGRWAIFNDDKVAESKETPFDMGYMYLYKRM